MTKETFGQGLRIEIDRAKISVNEAARRADMEPTKLRAWLRGQPQPLVGNAYKAVAAMGLSLDAVNACWSW